jgi:(1->4)-alpha-D-glucan 1-alpha-D-glucosylmutase
MDGLKKALVELSAVFPIYRTYLDGGPVSEHDQMYLRQAVGKARKRNTELGRELDFLETVLLLRIPETVPREDRLLWLSFVMRFQQFTSPLMAKGIEDTVFYVYNRLVSLNEVGGNPGRFGFSVDEFHELNAERARRHPLTMNASSTHDSKRGEDVRARIDVLSEIPGEWRRHLKEWAEQNAVHKINVNGREVPDPNQEYFLYQTLIGALPPQLMGPGNPRDEEHGSFVARIKSYMIKAAREAKIHTHWMTPDNEHELALERFVEAILAPADSNKFFQSLRALARRVAWFGYFNSLSQALLKISSPGLPDFYQGSELWDLNLVDPDNRRQVDYARRVEVLRRIRDKERSGLLSLIDELLGTIEDGRIKCFVTYRALSVRRKHQELFAHGDYIPFEVTGPRSKHVVAFARRLRDEWAIVAAPRLTSSLVGEGELPVGEEVWLDTSVKLPKEAPRRWRGVLTDEEIESSGGSIMLSGGCFRLLPLGFLVTK